MSVISVYIGSSDLIILLTNARAMHQPPPQPQSPSGYTLLSPFPRSFFVFSYFFFFFFFSFFLLDFLHDKENTEFTPGFRGYLDWVQDNSAQRQVGPGQLGPQKSRPKTTRPKSSHFRRQLGPNCVSDQDLQLFYT